MRSLVLSLVLFFGNLVFLLASPPVSVIANVRGKKFEVTAETVSEFVKEVENLSGLEAVKQSVLYRGKVLSPNDKLHEIGVSNGDVLNVLKGRKVKPPTIPRALKPKSYVTKSGTSARKLDRKKQENSDPFASMNQEQLQKELSKMKPEQLQKAMKVMETMLDSPEMDAYFNDDEKIETARLEILNNLDKFKNMPGASAEVTTRMREMAEDPKKWKQAMRGAKAQITALRKQRLQQQQAQKTAAKEEEVEDSDSTTDDQRSDDHHSSEADSEEVDHIDSNDSTGDDE